jgi:hypothetical protein
MQPPAYSQQIAKRIWFHFGYYLHAGIEFDSACGFGWYGDAGKTMAVVGNEAEKSHGNSQPFHVLASLRNGVAAVATIASAELNIRMI